LRSQHQKFTITNTSKGALDLTPLITGRHVGAFEINTDDITPLAAGQSREFEVSFHPDMGSGNYSAGIQFGADDTGCFVQLSAIATPALEGKNEPTLHHITQALGASVDVGGKTLSLDTEIAVIGKSVQAGGFALVKGETLKVTSVARFSPKGKTPFGVYDLADGSKMTEIGTLNGSSKHVPDAHQCLMPPASAVKVPASLPAHFGLYLAGPHYVSRTEAGESDKAKVKNTARIYPVTSLLGRRLKNAYLVGFEEAQNGDYQDALFLVEGVVAQ